MGILIMVRNLLVKVLETQNSHIKTTTKAEGKNSFQRMHLLVVWQKIEWLRVICYRDTVLEFLFLQRDTMTTKTLTKQNI